jgi:hypothetical protein
MDRLDLRGGRPPGPGCRVGFRAGPFPGLPGIGLRKAEWEAAWAQDLAAAGRKLLVVRVPDCDRPGLLAGVVGVDVFGIAVAAAMPREPRFPGALPQIFKVPARPQLRRRGPDLEKMARDLAAGSAVLQAVRGMGGVP